MTQAPCNYVPPEKVSSGIACGLILPHMITLSKQLTSAALGPNHITWEFVRNVMSWAPLRPNRWGTWTAEPSNLNFNRLCWSLRILLQRKVSTFHPVYSICPVPPIFFPSGWLLVPISPAPAGFHPNLGCSSVCELLLPFGLVDSLRFSRFNPWYLPRTLIPIYPSVSSYLSCPGQDSPFCFYFLGCQNEHPPSWWEPWPNLAQ